MDIDVEDKEQELAVSERRSREAKFLKWLCKRIRQGKVIPVISNYLFDDLLFDPDKLTAINSMQYPAVQHMRESTPGWNIEDDLAVAWANEEKVGYPFPEQHWLPRVALYDRVINSMDMLDSKERYLNWLKRTLLDQAEQDPKIELEPEYIAGLRKDLAENSFSETAQQLGYMVPAEGEDGDDPLTVLAKLNLPIYITTSPFDFLERAIIYAGRPHVRTQLCFWSDETIESLEVDEKHLVDRDYNPSKDEPLVYHIFGLEQYPESMVLNEDDYLDFLMKVSKDDDQHNQLVPLSLKGRISSSSLLLLGYRLRDWEFRVMFKGLLKSALEKSSKSTISTAIQIDPCQHRDNEIGDQSDGRMENEVEVKVHAYLESYFKDANIRVEWSTPHEFAARLWAYSLTC